jgi:hypothetical protein
MSEYSKSAENHSQYADYDNGHDRNKWPRKTRNLVIKNTLSRFLRRYVLFLLLNFRGMMIDSWRCSARCVKLEIPRFFPPIVGMVRRMTMMCHIHNLLLKLTR